MTSKTSVKPSINPTKAIKSINPTKAIKSIKPINSIKPTKSIKSTPQTLQLTSKITRLSSLSVFLPAYNEAGNLREMVEQTLAVLPQVAQKYELIIINDGSKDATRQIALTLATRYPQLVRVINQRNRGYGGALKRGFAEAQYDWIFFTDSDLQFDISEITKLVAKSPRSDLIIGYRLHRADGRRRQLIAHLLKIWNHFWLNFPTEIKDIDCAFKLIRHDVINEIQPLFSDGAMISTELLLKSHQAGFNFTQVGVHHYDRYLGESTGNNLKVIFKAVKDTFQLRSLLQKNHRLLSQNITPAIAKPKLVIPNIANPSHSKT